MIARETIFREYDIRGVFGVDFDAEFALWLGRALSERVRNCQTEGISEGRRTVAVGFDCRSSAPILTKLLIQGLTEGGVDVLNCGMGPTPQLYYMVFAEKLSGGVQITASHNPGDQNGFKIMIGEKTLSGVEIRDLRDTIERLRAQGGGVVFEPERGVERSTDARKRYTAELIERSRPYMGNQKVRVVVDSGNGVGGLVGPELLRELGCEVIELFSEPNGTFPNHHPDPTVLENLADLRKVVVEERAHVGIAFDGDADRIGVVDEKGQPIFGDMLLLIYGRQLLKELQHPKIIGDVKCSELLFSDLRRRGAEAIMSKTGHSLIKAKLREVKADLAGEMSGHMFFAHRFYGFDDALHAAARLVEILSNTTSRVSELLSDLPKMISTPEIRVDCPEEIKFKVAAEAKNLFQEFTINTLDGVRITFPNGWGLVRASNTQPALVMRFEATTPEALEEYRTLVESRIQELKQRLLAGACAT